MSREAELTAERDAALAQVAALHSTLAWLVVEAETTEWARMACFRAIADTRAAAEAHDARVRAEGYRAGLERGAEIADDWLFDSDAFVNEHGLEAKTREGAAHVVLTKAAAAIRAAAPQEEKK